MVVATVSSQTVTPRQATPAPSTYLGPIRSTNTPIINWNRLLTTPVTRTTADSVARDQPNCSDNGMTVIPKDLSVPELSAIARRVQPTTSPAIKHSGPLRLHVQVPYRL